ncbi:MAG TPA: 50S ribosomal protein L2 [Candidatus Paceibacterota bacterium]
MIKSYSPTSPSRRHLTNIHYGELSKVRPHKPLLRKLKEHAGRNSAGRITMRHQGGGNKRRYRVIDFKQDKINQSARVETLEYDPYRTAFIAKVVYSDGSRAYILAPHGVKQGDVLAIAPAAPLKSGNRMQLKNIPIGYQIHNIELNVGKGGQMARSAGSYAEVLGNTQGYTDLKMSSGELRRVSSEGYASLGQISNPEHNLINLGKAGRSRWLGVRPTVRGSVMNPVDHPYGGGEGRTQRGTRKPKTLWGKITGGHKTRNPKRRSSKFITKRRPKR